MKKSISIILTLLILMNVVQLGYAAKEVDLVKSVKDITEDFKVIDWKEKISIYDCVIDLAKIDLKEKDLVGIGFFKDGNMIGLNYDIKDSKIIIKNELLLNTSYNLKLFTNTSKYSIRFMTGDLPEIYETGNRIIVKVPAMPEKGFNWPYYLAIPSNNFKSKNKDFKRYLLVDTTNTDENNLEGFEKWVEDTLKNRRQYSVSVAENMWTPMLMPVFPKSLVFYENDNDINMFYEHAFDRDIATLHNKLEDPSLKKILDDLFKEKGYDVNKFPRQDEQLVAMFNHAVEYLNKYKHGVETDKMFLCGYSASGTFTDRFTALQPEKVKAVASGGTLDDMILPLDKLKNENLIFPIGTYDYKKITGRDFNLEKHNSVARLIFMGKDDTNNTLPYTDCYGNIERDIITKLWGVDVLPRAQELINLYGKSGGKGIFILDKNVGHGSSREMNDYVVEFLKANRNTNTQEYPIPANADQLQYKLFK